MPPAAPPCEECWVLVKDVASVRDWNSDRVIDAFAALDAHRRTHRGAK